MKIKKKVILSTAVCLLGLKVQAQDFRFVEKNPEKPDATEYWDPEVRVVTPGAIPSDAIMLFDGKNLDQWDFVPKFLTSTDRPLRLARSRTPRFH